MSPEATVLVPLYVYPSPGAWEPLLKAMDDFPDIEFIVIVNPNSGPGSHALPDANYVKEIRNLTAHSNVKVLGYVATNYTNRPLDVVKSEVRKYAKWPQESGDAGLAVSGVFFDEAPQRYNADAAAYIEGLFAFVKSSSGFHTGNMVVLNPGTVPDPCYLPCADMTVVFEATYDTFRERIRAGLFENICGVSGAQLGCLVHSVPNHVTGEELRRLLSSIRSFANVVFVTHLSENYYASFDSAWRKFLETLAS